MKKITALILTLAVVASQFTAVNAAASDTFDALENSLSAVEELLIGCEAKGMDVGYERIDYNTIKAFIEYGRDDISWGDTARAEYVATEIQEMYDDLYAKLSSYYNEIDRPVRVKRNTVSGFAGVQNGNFVDKNGEPIYYNGYGLYGWSNRDIFKDLDSFQGFGSDVTQIEITPNDTIFPKSSINGWTVTVSGNADASAEVIYAGDEHGNVARITNNTPYASNVYICMRQNINVSENTKYNISFKIKATNAQKISLRAMESHDVIKTHGNSSAYSTDGWITETGSYTTKAGETELKPTFYCEGLTEEFLIDDVVITESGKSENIVQNGDFEDEGNTSEHFRAWTATVGNKITRVLDRAQESNIMVDVLIQPGTFSRLTNLYPDAAEPSYGLGYNINSDIAKEALDLYVKTIMEQIQDHPALLGICISNEPNYNTSTDAENLPAYQNYLKELYNNNISTLNSVYGESNSSFSSVQFPPTGSGATRNAKFYEWARFNNTVVSGWNRYVAGLVKKYAPDVKVHAKVSSYFGNSNSAKWGIDIEEFSEFTDYIGNDGYAFYNQNGDGIVNKTMMYELLKSIAPNKPIINSEDHIYVDGSEHYDEEDTAHGLMDVWQGAIHGRDASMLWVWSRTSNKSSASYGNVLYRPDVVSGIGKTSLNLNKLSKQVQAFRNKENYVTFLWSDTNFIYTNEQKRDIFKAALFAGANPNYITERQLISGQRPSGVLVIPDIVNIRTEAYNAIKSYIQNGGTVWAVGNSCLTKNERNQSLSKLTFTKTISVSNAKTQFETLRERIVWGDSNKSLENVEILTTHSDGDTLINLVSYDWSGGNKRVYFTGTAVNLLTNQKYTGSIVISPYTPVLLRMTDKLYAFDATAEIGRTIVLTANIENKNTEDVSGKIYFKLLDEDGNVIKSAVYDNKIIRNSKNDAIKCSFHKTEDAYKAEVSAVIGGSRFKKEFNIE